MAKKKVAKASGHAAKSAPERTVKKKPIVAEPALLATLPSPVVIQRGTPIRFTVVGVNLFATTKVPPPTLEKTLVLYDDSEQNVIYTFPEGDVSVYDGGPVAFTVQAKRLPLKQSESATSGKLVITIHTGFPMKKTKKASFTATID
jgi:hypothetical protein